MDGILIIDKPAAHTSFDVVAIMRKLCGERRIGHTGTLDPMATGVLPLLLGRACRANALLPNQDKEYRAGFAFGKTSDTEDIWGTVREASDQSVTLADLERAAERYRGEIRQVPPMVSAVKKDGQRLYDLARKGIAVERTPRTVTVFALDILFYDEKLRTGTLRLRCSKGTYVRSVISGLGETLGVGGVMTSLRRTMASGFDLDASMTLDEARVLSRQQTLAARVLPVERVFMALPALQVTEKQARRFSNGGALSLDRIHTNGLSLNEGQQIRVRHPSGAFLGLGVIHTESNTLAVMRLFGGEAGQPARGPYESNEVKD